MSDEDVSLLCHRCGKPLRPGRGDWYVVRIEAFADPSPPELSRADLEGDLRAQMAEVIEQMERMSDRELMDQVYRKLTIHLCHACFGDWIEDPSG